MIRKIPAIAAVCMLFGALFSADRIAIAEPAAKGGVTPQEIETFWGMLESSVDGGYELVSRSALKQMLAEIGFTDNSGRAEREAEGEARRNQDRQIHPRFDHREIRQEAESLAFADRLLHRGCPAGPEGDGYGRHA